MCKTVVPTHDREDEEPKMYLAGNPSVKRSFTRFNRTKRFLRSDEKSVVTRSRISSEEIVDRFSATDCK